MNVLAFFAHPDDETMLAGGTLALLAKLGCGVHLLCATRGEGGDLGVPPICTREMLGDVRSAELACAAGWLGAAALCHITQHDLFIQKTVEDLGRPVTVPEVIQTRESLRRAFPQVRNRPHDRLAMLLCSSGAVIPVKG